MRRGDSVARVLLKTSLSPHSGWGQDGIGVATAMIRTGQAPFLFPLEVAPPLPQPVTRLLVRPLRPPFDLLLAHVSADRSRLPSVELAASRQRVLWSMWEWTTFANHPEIDDIRRNMSAYDTVVAYDPVSAGAFRSLGPSVPPVLTVQGGFDAAAWPYLERLWRPPVRFLLIGYLTDRKNPMAVLNAFAALLDQHGPARFDAELHIKFVDRMNPLISDPPLRSQVLDETAAVPEPAQEYLLKARGQDRVFPHVGTWSRKALLRLYASMHCLVAPSRGEGKNLAALEFMATGGAAIATRVGGHGVWLDDSYAYPLRCTLRPATWPVPTAYAEEADADLEHLQETMWRVYTNLGEARAKGMLAATAIPAGWDWSVALRRLREALAGVGIDGLATPIRQ
ncbi:MAG: glycosyltransferase [Pseudonocardiaceae bacterium]